jgi:serine/threonine protein kinase
MGEVYRARDPRLNRDVAIKTLRASSLADSDGRNRFTQEARAVSALSHPNIVTRFPVTGLCGSGTSGDSSRTEGGHPRPAARVER